MNNQLDTQNWDELSQDEQEQRVDWMEDSSTLPAEEKLIQVAKSFGTDEVIPNDKQLLQWTVNRIVSGDRAVLARLEQL
jgi:hypothetical protein